MTSTDRGDPRLRCKERIVPILLPVKTFSEGGEEVPRVGGSTPEVDLRGESDGSYWTRGRGTEKGPTPEAAERGPGGRS